MTAGKDGEMRITEVRYERVFNLGNYESERIGATMILDGTEPESDVSTPTRYLATYVEAEHQKLEKARQWAERR